MENVREFIHLKNVKIYMNIASIINISSENISNIKHFIRIFRNIECAKNVNQKKKKYEWIPWKNIWVCVYCDGKSVIAQCLLGCQPFHLAGNWISREKVINFYSYSDPKKKINFLYSNMLKW